MALRWHQKLSVKIAGIGLIFFALLAFSLHWSYSAAHRQMIESTRRDVQKLAHSVNASILTFVLHSPDGGVLIKELVVKLNENLNGVAVRIAHSPSLDQQYGVDPKELVDGRNEAESLADGRERFWEEGDNWRYAMPVKAVAGCGKCHVAPDGSGKGVPDGYVIATISFATSTQPMKERLAQLRWDLARNLAVIGALFVIMALFIRVYITKPLQVMLSAVQSVAGGGMEARAPISQADEIGRLGEGFNAMAGQMETSLGRLKSWNIDLAEEVERQTQSIREMRDRHQAIIDSTQRIIVTTDHDMKIESVNAEFDVYASRSDMPIRSANLVGRSLYAFLADDEKDHLKELCAPLLTGSREPCRKELDVELGVESRAFIMTISPLVNTKAEVAGLVFVLLDVTERKRAERALEFERNKLNAIMEGMDAAVTIITRDGEITYMNNHMEGLFGKMSMGHPCWEAVTGSQERCEGCETAFLTGRVSLEVKAVNGATYLATHSAITDIDGTRSVVVVLEDITYLKDMEGKLRRLVITDKLTGLYNKRHFTEKLADEMARAVRQETPLSLLFADIDKFKSYNDTYGHVGGDVVLARLGEIFSESIRAHVDTAYRYGGEEFTVILPGAGAEEALVVAERIRTTFAAHAFHPAVNGDETEVRKTISIGLATMDGKEEMDVFIARADALMYVAKKEGGNKVRLEM
jgi:diguanylate cyclase (GGDEF)-like protein/PAS domain S-box-containing protein